MRARPPSKKGQEQQPSADYFVSNDDLRENACKRVPRLRYESDSTLLDALKKLGCAPGHNSDKTRRGRRFPPLAEMRSNWEKLYGPWRSDAAEKEWT